MIEDVQARLCFNEWMRHFCFLFVDGLRSIDKHLDTINKYICCTFYWHIFLLTTGRWSSVSHVKLINHLMSPFNLHVLVWHRCLFFSLFNQFLSDSHHHRCMKQFFFDRFKSDTTLFVICYVFNVRIGFKIKTEFKWNW